MLIKCQQKNKNKKNVDIMTTMWYYLFVAIMSTNKVGEQNMKRQKKNGNRTTLEKTVLVTAILNLIRALIELLNRLIE